MKRILEFKLGILRAGAIVPALLGLGALHRHANETWDPDNDRFGDVDDTIDAWSLDETAVDWLVDAVIDKLHYWCDSGDGGFDLIMLVMGGIVVAVAGAYGNRWFGPAEKKETSE